jgi:hypothetical protein
MIARSLVLAIAAAGVALLAAPAESLAAPKPVLAPPAEASLVQEVDTYKRRWRRDNTHVRAPLTAVDDVDGDTWVRAPFARVYSGRRGTWVRAPFVNLWIPR